MDKLVIVCILAIVILVIFGAVSFYQGSQNSTVSEGVKYLQYANGDLSKFYLVNSSMSYVTSDQDYKDGTGEIYVKKGTPYVLINGTIRNDYDTDYYIMINAEIFNDTSSEPAAYVIPGHGEPYFNWPYFQVKKHNVASFDMRILYDKTDVSSYYIYLPATPTEQFLP